MILLFAAIGLVNKRYFNTSSKHPCILSDFSWFVCAYYTNWSKFSRLHHSWQKLWFMSCYVITFCSFHKELHYQYANFTVSAYILALFLYQFKRKNNWSLPHFLLYFVLFILFFLFSSLFMVDLNYYIFS